MRSLVLNFLLLVLKISLNLSLDAIYKYCRFSKTILEKSLKFILNKKNRTIAFNLNFVLLPAKVNLILEKQNYKRDILAAHGTSLVKMIFIQLTEVIALHIQASIVQVEVSSFKRLIVEYNACSTLAIFLVLNK